MKKKDNSQMALSKRDFLDGIVGKAVDLEVEGLGTVKVKSLTVLQMKELQTQYEGDEIGAAIGAVVKGMVEPSLDEDDVPTLYNAIPGTVMQISKRIMELSGLAVEENEDSPN